MSAVAELEPMTVKSQRMTADELLDMRDGNRFELVNGQLVERNMGWESEWVGTNLIILFGLYIRQHGGWINGSNASYRCFKDSIPDDPERVRMPDVSFIAAERLSMNDLPKGHCELVPDLVVEVTSPNDRYSEVEAKVEEYLEAGVRLVWVIDPPTESIRIHRLNGTVETRHADDLLNGEDVLLGFECPIGPLFQHPSQLTS